ncbi:hypothetical protein IscW_ISCW000397, partial [Ixodes scapularis]
RARGSYRIMSRLAFSPQYCDRHQKLRMRLFLFRLLVILLSHKWTLAAATGGIIVFMLAVCPPHRRPKEVRGDE